MADDRYTELLEDARDALYALLKESEPDTDRTLRIAYADLKRLIDQEHRTSREDRWEEDRRRERVWKTKSATEREHVVLNALGDERLAIRELVGRLNEHSDFRVYDPDVRRVIRRLFAVGEVVRVNGAAGAAVRYRYSRNTELSGPVADLEHAFHERSAS